MPDEGAKAPAFSLPGLDAKLEEKEYRLEDLLKEGQSLILYFYPRDNTPGCTTEACDFRDNLSRLTSRAMVIGVSRDSIKSHKKFMEQHGLAFPLLSDTEHSVMEAYEAWGEKKMYGKTTTGVIRSTYLIGKDGIIKKKWRNVKAKGHVEKVLLELDKLES